MPVPYNHAALAWVKAYLVALGNGAEVWLMKTHRPANWHRADYRTQLRLV